MSKKRICITGSNGFIGGSLARHLEKLGHPVFRWNRHKPGDLGKSQIIVHLASRVHHTKSDQNLALEKYIKDNTELTVRLLEAAIQQNVKKFVFISTVKVVGETPGYFDLESPCIPADAYGISKLKAESKIEALIKRYPALECIILRLPMVYGPGNKGNMLSLLKAAANKIPLPLASAAGKRSIIGIKNAIDAICVIIEDTRLDRSKYRQYFIHDAKDITSAQLYSMIFQRMHAASGLFWFPELMLRLGGKFGSRIGAILKRDIPLNVATVSRLFDEYRFASHLFENDYLWKPPYTTKDGIQETVEWYLHERSGNAS